VLHFGIESAPRIAGASKDHVQRHDAGVICAPAGMVDAPGMCDRRDGPLPHGRGSGARRGRPAVESFTGCRSWSLRVLDLDALLLDAAPLIPLLVVRPLEPLVGRSQVLRVVGGLLLRFALFLWFLRRAEPLLTAVEGISRLLVARDDGDAAADVVGDVHPAKVRLTAAERLRRKG